MLELEVGSKGEGRTRETDMTVGVGSPEATFLTGTNPPCADSPWTVFLPVLFRRELTVSDGLMFVMRKTADAVRERTDPRRRKNVIVPWGANQLEEQGKGNRETLVLLPKIMSFLP